MRLRNGGFGRGETRSSALWGSGNGRGDKRRWTRVARFAAAPLAALAAVTPLAASAHSKQQSQGGGAAYVAPSLERAAAKDPHASLHVIVSSANGIEAARKAVQGVGATDQRLPIADAVSTDVAGADLSQLSQTPGLTVTPDALVTLDSSSKQLWPYAVGADKLWATTAGLLGKKGSDRSAPTIAIVDSGIDATRADFGKGKKGTRVLKQVTMTSLVPNSPGDGRGHGTFVAGLAAGDGRDYAGAAPSANLVSLDVMDDNGMARTSDVIAAADWILTHKHEYNIRVANFSLHSSTPSSFTRDPLDRAVERLWLNGVVVVTSSGNYGSATGPSGVRYAPGNDPFVITVGALDLQKSFRAKDHVAAPWSAYGYTFDGFMKPEVVAPGRYLIGPVPANSTLALERPAQMVGADHIQLSGTSFSAAVVSGVAADLLALHPDWSPDQLKGALMLTARPDVNAAPLSTGVGEVDAASAAMAVTPPNPNLALEGFVNPNPDDGGLLSFDTVSWSEVAKSAVSWDQSAWDPASWSTAAWSLDYWADVSWDQVSYSDVSYDDVSYDDVSYDAVSYSDVSYEDAVLGDILTGGYPLQGAIGAP